MPNNKRSSMRYSRNDYVNDKMQNWGKYIKNLDDVLRQINQETTISIGFLPYFSLPLGLILSNQLNYCVKFCKEIEYIRQYMKLTCLEEQAPKIAAKINGFGYLIKNLHFQAYLGKLRDPFRLLFNHNTSSIQAAILEKNLPYIGNPPAMQERVLTKFEFRKLIKELGLPHLQDFQFSRVEFVSKSFSELNSIFNSSFVVQRGDFKYGGEVATFFINEEKDLRAVQELFKNDERFNIVELSPFVEGNSLSMIGCATRFGTITGPLQSQLIDIPESMHNCSDKGVSLGHDWGLRDWAEGTETAAEQMVKTIGDYLFGTGYKGIFGIDFIYDNQTDRIFPLECNPRFTGSFPLISLIDIMEGLPPFDFLHLIEHRNIDACYDWKLLTGDYKFRSNFSQISVTAHGIDKMPFDMPFGVYLYDEADDVIKFNRPEIFPWNLKANEFLVVDSILPFGSKIDRSSTKLFKLIFPVSIAETSFKLKPKYARIVKEFSGRLHKNAEARQVGSQPADNKEISRDIAIENNYNHQEIEKRINLLWGKGKFFTPKIDQAKKPYSIFLTPPNASGEMHVGNALMIAIQDILARYHRAKGDPTLWIPCTDHGGYETQVTFERELEKSGIDRLNYTSKEFFEVIKLFVEGNNETIKGQIKALGASVDWSRFRFTMDEESLVAVNKTFKKMVADNLIYRHSYMAHYCPLCATILADIELKETKETMPLYFIKFTLQNSDDFLTLATTRPEFLFAVTHALIHPTDKRYANHIGRTLLNPVTGKPVEIVASKRKFDPENPDPFLTPFSPSYKKYDYEYTLRNSIPSQNLLDWEGRMLERYPGLTPKEARVKELAYLEERGRIEKIDDSYLDTVSLCKRGHAVESVIMQTWFLKMDDEKIPLRNKALEAIKQEGLEIFPRWREKGLISWLEKMTDWPIARQNVWGIKIPVWYDISEPSKFTVWFVDKAGEKRCGNLQALQDQGVTLEEVSGGLERVYAAEDASWTLEPEAGKSYLPETDTFDTWFSSGQWGTIVFGSETSADFSYFYPSDSIVIGHDLLRLSVSRKILLSLYLTGRLPFEMVYLHRLINGQDGQKMSKSLGNAVSLEYYLEKFGADVTRMALISYTTEREDFILEEERLIFYQDFSSRLWKVGQQIKASGQDSLNLFKPEDLSREDKYLLSEIDRLPVSVGSAVERYAFALAQEKLCHFLLELEKYVKITPARKNRAVSLSVIRYVYKKYLVTLHPFMPFMTEELYANLYNSICPLTANPWPDKMNYFGE